MNAISRARVLVVDDDEMQRVLARAALEHAGFEVVEADDGARLIEAFARDQPDIVLLDVLMPGLDGFAACTALRAEPGGAHVPVLMMTGLDDVESINRAYEAGATDFVTKPINLDLLKHRLRYMLRAKLTADELRASEARLALAQRIARLGYWQCDHAGRITRWAAESFDVLGLPRASALARLTDLAAYASDADRERLASTLSLALGTGDSFSLEFRREMAAGGARDIHVVGVPEAGAGGELRYVGTLQDISERRQAEQRIHQLAFFDPTTGLPNRASIRAHLVQALASAVRGARTLAVLSIDLDHFQRINDTLGYAVGNEVLRVVGERFRTTLRISDALAHAADNNPVEAIGRVGGDEFIAVLPEIGSAEDAAVVARRLRAALSKPIASAGKEIYVGASVGISVHPEDGTNADDLLRHADAALAQAKREGRDCYQFYTAALNARAFQRLTVETHLRRALEREQFAVYFQPKLRSADLALVGFEALVRWHHPELGRVSPAEFIPIAEDTGLIVPIGEWVLVNASRQLVAWEAAGFGPLRCAVNLSGAQFRVDDLHRRVAALIGGTGLDTARIDLELTESILMADGDAAIRTLQDLKTHGFGIAVDDFGTGYSSLSYLKRLPIDVLKIDQSFVRDLATDADDAAIVSTIITMARSLRLKVVAEGVEKPEQLEFLRRHHCDEVQGYLFSPPLAAAEMEAWMTSRRALDPAAG